MAALSLLYPIVRLHAKNAPEITMDLAIRHAAREFCRKTWWLRRTIAVQVVAGQAYYVLSPAEASEDILGVVAVEYGEDYGPLQPDQREWHRYRAGCVSHYAFEPPSRLQLMPYPADTETYLPEMLVRTANCPTIDADTIADEVVNEMDHAIAHGALSYLLSMPDEAWSNPRLSQDMRKMFEMDMLSAKSDSIFGHVHRGQSIKLRSFNI